MTRHVCDELTGSRRAMENVDINYINFGVKVVMAVAGDGGSRYAL